MSCQACCNCTTPSCSLISTNQRPSNGSWSVNKLFANYAVCTPVICSKTGVVNLNGNVFGPNNISLSTETTVGESQCSTASMVVLTNTNGNAGTYATVDTTASQFAILPAVAVGSTFYVGGDDKFVSLSEITKVAEASLSTKGVWEYWNGSAWTTLNVMTSGSVSPHTQYANTPFERVTTTVEDTRIDDISATWQKTTLNLVNKYWVRFRVTSLLTAIPEVSSLKICGDHVKIGVDGFIETYGSAETKDSTLLPLQLINTPDVAPAANAVDLSGTLSLDGGGRLYLPNADAGMGALAVIKPGTDTSKPLVVNFSFATVGPLGAVAGNVVWEVEIVPVSIGTTLAAGPSVSDQVTVAILNSLDLTQNASVSLNVPTLVTGNAVGVRISRLGTDVADTYTQNVNLYSVALETTKWN